MTPQGRVLLKWFTTCWHTMFKGRNLLLTNTVSSGILLAVGDSIQQAREIRKDSEKNRDWQRTGRMFVIGTCLGPVDHYWYILLDRILPSASIRAVVQKVLTEQILASPIFSALFFMGIGSFEGQTLNGSWNEFQSKFWEMYKAEWCVWPPAQLINFYFLPTKYRVMYVNFITLGWDVYLSYLKHRVSKDEKCEAVGNATPKELSQEP
ncbi:mpv17-like protein 2 [Pyxicephalus adspersus]|uniref:Mpv17-like protein 2 n=1 Tax=Pyxicephalus adspersus TaxID=30357 RepID=A0AAV3B1V8_PYXAD|nr:TPA: hypothetical protein GDO54_008912 [Pyxicephalus adspersus]